MDAALERRERSLGANLTTAGFIKSSMYLRSQFRGDLARLSKGSQLFFILRLRSFTLSPADDGEALRY